MLPALLILLLASFSYILNVYTGGDLMFTAKVFKSGNSQAIRIPKPLSTDKEEFTINKIGEVYILTPSDDPWFLLRESLGSFSDDFMNDREQPLWAEQSEREEL